MGNQSQNTNCTYILLAAGFSRRFGDKDKRQTIIDDRSMFELVLNSIPIGPNDELRVVVRNKQKWSHLQLSDSITLIENTEAEKGLASSLRAGLIGMSKKSELFMVCLADMPLLKKHHYMDLLSYYYNRANEKYPLIVMPQFNRISIGHPRLFSSEFKSSFLSSLEQESNKALIEKFKVHIDYFQTDDRAFVADIDTPADLRGLSV